MSAILMSHLIRNAACIVQRNIVQKNDVYSTECVVCATNTHFSQYRDTLFTVQKHVAH